MNAPRRALPVASLAVLLCALQTGCITTPLERRDWRTLETPHFEILTTYDADDARRLGQQLEQFRLAAEFVWGREIPAGPRRIRVIAFEGSSSDVQPFRLRGRAASYLSAGPAGEVIALRSGLGWSEDAPTELRLELARHWYRNAAPASSPPWLVEGLAQVASTSDVRGGRRVRAMDVVIFPVLLLKLVEMATDANHRVNAGQPRSDHIALLRSSAWVPLERVLSAGDLEGWSQTERALFEAESWALAHLMRFGGEVPDVEEDPLARLRRELARGVPARAAARSAMGRDLERRLLRHVRADRFDSVVLAVRPSLPESGVRAAEAAEVAEALGRLSLAVGRPDPASRYFEAAATDRPSAHAGLCAALARRGSESEARRACERALDTGPDEPDVRRLVGDAERALAEIAPEVSARRSYVDASTASYRLALEQRPDDLAALYGLAASHLQAGDGADAREVLAALLRWRPGDPEVQRLSARAELAVGDREAARRRALRAVTVARDDAEIEAARALLEEIDRQVARH